MDLRQTVFHRKFSMSMYRNLRLPLGQMTFTKDFISTTRGEVYPVMEKSEDCEERLADNRYHISRGKITRLLGQFFPFATYEICFSLAGGECGFRFQTRSASAGIMTDGRYLFFRENEREESLLLHDPVAGETTLVVSCRPGAFDVCFVRNEKPCYVHTFESKAFQNTNHYEEFSAGCTAVCARGGAVIREASLYIDNGISQADIRPIRYDNGEIMLEQGKVYLTASIRMQEGTFQGIFSWVPGTACFELTGALFYDSGDGRWCGDVAASILYHREKKLWYLWVCAFSHGHILGHAAFPGDPRFGVNVVDIELMEPAPVEAPISVFAGFEGDEDPDFFYDEQAQLWRMAICRIDPSTGSYRYVFFQSDAPFAGYTYTGAGLDGAETGGSFVRIEGKLYFICGNSFERISDYRVYDMEGMTNARFDYPDGGFRGWGSLIPVRMGSRERYYWLTFDRHNGSAYPWSYGNIYCFESEL